MICKYTQLVEKRPHSSPRGVHVKQRYSATLLYNLGKSSLLHRTTILCSITLKQVTLKPLEHGLQKHPFMNTALRSTHLNMALKSTHS